MIIVRLTNKYDIEVQDILHQWEDYSFIWNCVNNLLCLGNNVCHSDTFGDVIVHQSVNHIGDFAPS
jgi:hypothetical protein